MSTVLPPRPTRNLVGKVAIVTGAGTDSTGLGNGRATAILLAEDGASVACVDLDRSLAQQTVDMILQGDGDDDDGSDRGQRRRAVAVAADVTSERDCAACVARAVAELGGGLDILVNNVGVLGPRGTAETVDTAAWAAGLETNVTSVMMMARHAVPAMRGRGGGGGSIVNIGSVAGLQGGMPSLLYPTSKGAVVNMTRAMAAHHGEEGIRVNCVCPGMVYTPMVCKPGMSPEMREARRNRSLLKTEGNAWDVAHAVRFLAGDEARWITGTVLTVDAGASCASFIPVSSNT